MIERKRVSRDESAGAAACALLWREKLRCPGFVCLLLALATLGVFLPAARHDFVNYDDPGYVTENFRVQEGLTWEGVMWAFTSGATGNWIPLTWLSHMSDCRLYGLNPAGHHLTSLFLHTANVLLLFLILKGMTGAVWRSAFVAALFAWHPLHVESVAWVSERKDVLSTFFWMLTLGAYGRYAQEKGARTQHPNIRITRHASLYYALSLLFFVLGLMSKAMVVTLPFVLLLLDYWPLGRLRLSTANHQPATIVRLLVEKLPFVLLSLLASVVAFVVQKNIGAVTSLNNLPVDLRLANAVISYPRYLAKMLWPADLAVLYPHPIHWPVWQVSLAGLLLLGVSFWAVRLVRSRPYLLVGWLWFLGTLVPVIGLVQVGSQSIADRYTYIPSIGLLIALAWYVSDLWRTRHSPMVLGLAAGAVLTALAGTTRCQLSHWRNSESLFGYALKVTDKNTTAHNNRGFYLAGKGRVGEAMSDFNAALQINPEDADAHNNLGSALAGLGRLPEAVTHYEAALRLEPDHAGAHYNLGKAYESIGQMKEAMTHYSLAIRAKPEYADAHNNLGAALAAEGQFQEAEFHLKQAVRLKPDSAEAHNNLGNILTARGRNAEAVIQFSAALRLKPDYLNAHSNLGLALVRMGKIAEALEQYDAVLRLNPDDVDALCSKAWILSAREDPRFRNGPEAVRLATRAASLTQKRDAGVLDALASAYAESGRFADATNVARRAEQCATASGQLDLAARIRERLQLYQSGRCYREP